VDGESQARREEAVERFMAAEQWELEMCGHGYLAKPLAPRISPLHFAHGLHVEILKMAYLKNHLDSARNVGKLEEVDRQYHRVT